MKQYNGVADTLFLPLTAKINMSKKYPNFFYDNKSLEIEPLIKDDLINIRTSEYNEIAAIARTYNFDEMTQAFINAHPTCNIVNLGAGLDAPYYRLDRKNAIFYELDLPQVMELRKGLLPENKNEKNLVFDLFDIGWLDEIDQSLPTLILVSGVFQYQQYYKVLELIKNIKTRLDYCELIFDATPKSGLIYTNLLVKHTGNNSAKMNFYVNSAVDFAKACDSELLECRMFYTAARRQLKKASPFTKLCMWVCDHFKMAKIIHLRL